MEKHKKVKKLELIEKNPKDIRNLFNKIAPQYDRNNTIISLGLHILVKKSLVNSLDITSGEKILDACCGTGDISKLIKKRNCKAELTGADFSEEMLKIAQKRVKDVNFIKTDVTDLPFKDGNFDKVVMSFGLRNIKDYGKALDEVWRVLKFGGEFVHLDFGEKVAISKTFDYITRIACKMLFKEGKSYEYLLQSKREFFPPDKLIKEFEAHGFSLVRRKDFLFGIISFQVLRKV